MGRKGDMERGHGDGAVSDRVEREGTRRGAKRAQGEVSARDRAGSRTEKRERRKAERREKESGQ